MLTKEKWFHFEEITSTNTYLLENTLPHGTVITATSQKAGRGRKERNWYDVPGSSFLCSVLLYMDRIQFVNYFSLLVALSIVEGIKAFQKMYGLESAGEIFIKWPNDILLVRENGVAGKLGGILVESVYLGTGWKVVAGIGLNWNRVPEFDNTSLFPPVSLLSGNGIPPISFLEFLFQKWNELSVTYPYPFEAYSSMIHSYHYLYGKKIIYDGGEYIVEKIQSQGYLAIRNVRNGGVFFLQDWEERIQLI